MSKKKRQHYIPKVILKKFLENKTYFNLYNKKYNKFEIKGVSNSMFNEYFYEHFEFPKNEVEDLLSEREKLYGELIEKIINKEKITLEDFNLLLEFRHVTYYRSNEFHGFHSYKKNKRRK
jgi:hypothetical protein